MVDVKLDKDMGHRVFGAVSVYLCLWSWNLLQEKTLEFT